MLSVPFKSTDDPGDLFEVTDWMLVRFQAQTLIGCNNFRFDDFAIWRLVYLDNSNSICVLLTAPKSGLRSWVTGLKSGTNWLSPCPKLKRSWPFFFFSFFFSSVHEFCDNLNPQFNIKQWCHGRFLNPDPKTWKALVWKRWILRKIHWWYVYHEPTRCRTVHYSLV